MSEIEVAIIGGGPSGLQAALTLGRARKRVVLFDNGARRNAAAAHINNFVTRDGIAPDELRRIGREQLAKYYPQVTTSDARITAITGERNAFELGEIRARRVLLCTGMIDTMLPIDGFREQWGRSIFQCPFCHGWEVSDQPWGFLLTPQTLPHAVPFALQALGWTNKLTVFANGQSLAAEGLATLEAAGIAIEAAAVTCIDAGSIALADGKSIACAALFAHPPQQQVELVRSLDLALDGDGLVTVDPMRRETSRPGIYAAGDLATRMQGAILAASTGAQTAAMINVDLAMDRAPR